MWMRLAVIIGAVLIVVSGGGLITIKVLFSSAVSNVGQIDINPGTDNDSVVKGHALVGALNILLVGIDDGRVEGVDERKLEPTRADSIMILHVPASHDRGYLVSLPRDLWVKIPKYPKTGYGGGSGKLNQAYTAGFGDARGGGPGQAGGLDLLMRTIKDVTGITFNAAATVNFTGFTAAVKVLGGVTMYIDERVTSVHYGFYPDGSHCVPALFDGNGVAYPIKACKGRVFEKGTRRLTPEEALDYTRQREWMELGDGDYGRQRHQQQFIKALVQEAKAQGLTTNLPKALSFVKAVGGAVNMWTNNEELADWFLTLKDVAANNVTMIKTNAGKYNPAPVSGTSAEALSEQSKEMFQALRTGKIDDFLFLNSDWINRDS
ncbi:hypothetical protein Rhe02_31760 [Rhizocola hellebori]|uniref:Cell envelope-related transcriptional attenuator domain-containing protein n=1 Tax=Rhizocola hellebori TaxID=1392758 RepID=A0A8J3VF67_9ACTN|nr:hypothetical protein Rhe02_31760 [Rhizocola hellebori]